MYVNVSYIYTGKLEVSCPFWIEFAIHSHILLQLHQRINSFVVKFTAEIRITELPTYRLRR